MTWRRALRTKKAMPTTSSAFSDAFAYTSADVRCPNACTCWARGAWSRGLLLNGHKESGVRRGKGVQVTCPMACACSRGSCWLVTWGVVWLVTWGVVWQAGE
eukprot:2718505-Rhodomonas_salina.1